MGESRELADALDALEMMAEQYLCACPDGDLDHSFMSAGEYASEVLSQLRPDRWIDTGTGLRRINTISPSPLPVPSVEEALVDDERSVGEA